MDKIALFCGMNILLIAATGAEIAPSTEYIGAQWERVSDSVFRKDGKELHICITGVGMVATAYHLTKKLTGKRFDIAIQAGIGGAFDRSIGLGEVVFVTSEQYGDLGAEDRDAYLDIFEMGLLEKDVFPFTNGRLETPDAPSDLLIGLRQVKGLTVNLVTGNEKTVQRLAETYGAEVESMEGAAFHYVCLQENIAFAQVRAISNYVEPRDRSKWKMKEAITGLNNWLTAFVGQL